MPHTDAQTRTAGPMLPRPFGAATPGPASPARLLARRRTAWCAPGTDQGTGKALNTKRDRDPPEGQHLATELDRSSQK